MIQLDAELLRELEAILLHGDFELAYLKSSAVLEEAGNDVFASAPLALRLFYVLLQSAFFSSSQTHLLAIINSRLGGLNKLPTQVFLLWQLLQLDEGEVNTCKLETESFLDELVALHRQKSLQHVTQVTGGAGMRIFSDGTLDISAASQKDLLGAAMAIAAAGTRTSLDNTKGPVRGTIGEFLAMQRAATAAVKGAGGAKKAPEAVVGHARYFALPHQDVGGSAEQTVGMVAAVHNKVADSLHGSQADLACHLDRENSHPQLPAPSPSLPPPATPPPPPSDPASLLALHQHQHHNSHAHAGPVHVYDWLADGGEHMHVVALCRFYLVDLLCHEVHDNDAAESFLCSEEAFLILEERDREALRAEVVAAELASAAQAVGSSRGSRARLSSDFMTMMGEMDEGPDWNRSDQGKGSSAGANGTAATKPLGLRHQSGVLISNSAHSQPPASSWASGAWGSVAGCVGWVRRACGLQPAGAATQSDAGGQPGGNNNSSGSGSGSDLFVALAAAVVLFAVYKEREAIKRSVRQRTTTTWAAAQEFIRMAFTLTPSPVASGYRPAYR